MRDRLVLFLNGRRFELPASSAFQPLSDFLRNDRGLTGTKVVCAEGDCGSCTVLVGRVGPLKLDYKPVCSCIAYLYQLDGAHVVTIEGLTPGNGLHPVQQAMMTGHASQCGFCTPGFVVTTCAMLEQPSSNVRRALSGNLCRCTGYEAILNAVDSVKLADVTPVSTLYSDAKLVIDQQSIEADELLLSYDGRTFYKPVTVAQAVAFRVTHPGCTIIAGGTDLGVVMNKGLRDPKVLLGTTAVVELNQLTLGDDVMSVGANVTLSRLETFAETHLPELAKILWRHGSPLTRNFGTLAGNIANGSPIGDTMPALFVLNASVELTGPAGVRRVNLNDFYTGYRTSVLRDDELITRVLIPLPDAGDVFKLYKISKRHDLDISGFTAAVWMRVNGSTIESSRVALGGVAATIVRLRDTENLLRGAPFSEQTMLRAGETASGEIAPLSDVRGSAEYRTTLARNIFLRLWHDLHPAEPAVAPAQGNGEAH